MISPLLRPNPRRLHLADESKEAATSPGHKRVYEEFDGVRLVELETAFPRSKRMTTRKNVDTIFSTNAKGASCLRSIQVEQIFSQT